MTEAAIRGALHNFKPYQDGGGTITLMLSAPEWAAFMAWTPELHIPMAVARMVEDALKSTGTGP